MYDFSEIASELNVHEKYNLFVQRVSRQHICTDYPESTPGIQFHLASFPNYDFFNVNVAYWGFIDKLMSVIDEIAPIKEVHEYQSGLTGKWLNRLKKETNCLKSSKKSHSKLTKNYLIQLETGPRA